MPSTVVSADVLLAAFPGFLPVTSHAATIAATSGDTPISAEQCTHTKHANIGTGLENIASILLEPLRHRVAEGVSLFIGILSDVSWKPRPMPLGDRNREHANQRVASFGNK